MTAKEINNIMNEYAEYKIMSDQVAAELERLGKMLKEFLDAAGIDNYSGEHHKMKISEYKQATLNTAALKAEHPEICKAYTEEKQRTRFIFN